MGDSEPAPTPVRRTRSLLLVVSTIASVAVASASSPQLLPPAAPKAPQRAAGASLAGRVVNAVTAVPLVGAIVRVTGAGETRVVMTDEEGRFVIGELPPGRFTLFASKGGFVGSPYGQVRPGGVGAPIDVERATAYEKLNIGLAPGAVITGALIDEHGQPVVGAVVSASRLALVIDEWRVTAVAGADDTTDDRGTYRLYGLAPGQYYVAGRAAAALVASLSRRGVAAAGNAPTYYPGATSLGAATAVVVEAGAEIGGVNFTLSNAGFGTVRGRAASTTGRSLGPGVVTLFDRGSESLSGGPTQTGLIQQDGQFEVRGVPPGTYELVVRSALSVGALPEYGSTTVVVSEGTVDGVFVSASTGATARGRIVSDGARRVPDSLRLAFRSAERGVDSRVQRDQYGANGTFEVAGLFGRQLVRLSRAGAEGWALRTVLVNGLDVTDGGINFERGRDVTGLTVVVTDAVTRVAGRVEPGDGPPSEVAIVVFPSDERLWSFRSRFVMQSMADSQGRYSIEGLPPRQDYLVAAVRTVQPAEILQPSVLRRMRGMAVSVSLAEGESKALDLRAAEP